MQGSPSVYAIFPTSNSYLPYPTGFVQLSLPLPLTAFYLPVLPDQASVPASAGPDYLRYD
jgi:hypothetical protein